MYKCWCNGLVTNYSIISRADAVKLLPAVPQENGGHDRQLVHEILIDGRAIVLVTERGPGFSKHPFLGYTFDGKQDSSARGRCSSACIEQGDPKILPGMGRLSKLISSQKAI